MKKTIVVFEIGVLAVTLISFTGKDRCTHPHAEHEANSLILELQKPFQSTMMAQLNALPLSIDAIHYVEIEEEIQLGFDTSTYLPKGFNAFEGMVLNLNDIDFVEEEEVIELGFDPSIYLPKGFNAYEGMVLNLETALQDLDLDEIIYLVEEEGIDLGFDTSKYLPEGFNAYAQ